MNNKKIIITNALTYANGEMHPGHLLGFIQADIWKRYNRLIGNKCWHVCGNDCHGLPIMIKADSLNLNYQEFTNHISISHQEDLKSCEIFFDLYLNTDRLAHKKFVSKTYHKLVNKNLIYKKWVMQAFDDHHKIFLADRYLIGECPFCGAQNQWGDNCVKCGGVYEPQDLINPLSTLSGTKPIFKENIDLFFKLTSFTEKLKQLNFYYLEESHQKNMLSWLNSGLRDWSIAREKPYYGIDVPDEINKMFYVWFDAPLGYLSLINELSDIDLDQELEVYHYIGKDIIYMHAIHYPALLLALDYPLPTKIVVNGFLQNKDQAKISKSSATYQTVKEYFNEVSPLAFRYFVAAKSAGDSRDIALAKKDNIVSFNEFVVNKLVSLYSRCVKLLAKYNYRLVADQEFGQLNLVEFTNKAYQTQEECSKYYESGNFSNVCLALKKLVSLGHDILTLYQPWNSSNNQLNHEVISISLYIFKVAIGLANPIMPSLSENYYLKLGLSAISWQDIPNYFSANHYIDSTIMRVEKIELKNDI